MVFKESLFSYQNKNSLDGTLITHVDDFCWGGVDNFRDSIRRPLKNVFSISAEFPQTFTFFGLNINQTQNVNITLDQIQSVEKQFLGLLIKVLQI